MGTSRMARRLGRKRLRLPTNRTKLSLPFNIIENRIRAAASPVPLPSTPSCHDRIHITLYVFKGSGKWSQVRANLPKGMATLLLTFQILRIGKFQFINLVCSKVV